jgi:hypothetical protein
MAIRRAVSRKNHADRNDARLAMGLAIKKAMPPEARAALLDRKKAGSTGVIDYAQLYAVLNQAMKIAFPEFSELADAEPVNFASYLGTILDCYAGADGATRNDGWEDALNNAPVLYATDDPTSENGLAMGLKGRFHGRKHTAKRGEITEADKRAARRLLGLKPKT